MAYSSWEEPKWSSRQAWVSSCPLQSSSSMHNGPKHPNLPGPPKIQNSYPETSTHKPFQWPTHPGKNPNGALGKPGSAVVPYNLPLPCMMVQSILTYQAHFLHIIPNHFQPGLPWPPFWCTLHHHIHVLFPHSILFIPPLHMTKLQPCWIECLFCDQLLFLAYQSQAGIVHRILNIYYLYRRSNI